VAFTDTESIVRKVEDDDDDEGQDNYDDNYLRRLEQPSSSDYGKNGFNRPLSTT